MLIRRAISLTKSKCPFGPRRHYRRDEEAADALTGGAPPRTERAERMKVRAVTLITGPLYNVGRAAFSDLVLNVGGHLF